MGKVMKDRKPTANQKTASPGDKAPLPNDVPLLQEMVRDLLEQLGKERRAKEQLEHKVDELVRRLYGPSSERADSNQLLLFAMEETKEALSVDDPEEPTDPERKRRARRRKTSKRVLERRREVHELSEGERQCDCCKHAKSPIREEVTEQYDYQQAAVFIREHVRIVYACTRGCESKPQIAPKPPQPIEKGIPGPGLLAYIVNSKYSDSLPLYRLEGILARHGLEVSRSTMCGWVRAVAELVQPVVDYMKAEVLMSFVIATDETPLKVLDRANKRHFKGRIWVYCGDEDHPWLVYDYTPTRERDGPENFLRGYSGYLQAYAYSGYDRLFASGEVIELACLMHARRYWFNASLVDPAIPMQAIGMIRVLYRIEGRCRNLSPEERFAYRQEHAVPILDRFETWIDEIQPWVLPKSPLGDAVRYTRNQWAALRRYTEDGRFLPDNGRSERALKHVAINRKNWLFAGSQEGGRWAATIWSLVATCRLHGIDCQRPTSGISCRWFSRTLRVGFTS